MTDMIAYFFGDGNELALASLPDDLRNMLDPSVQRADRGDAIAFLPRAVHGRLWWYGFAPNRRSRRELLGFLDAWIGPTTSDLSHGRGRLDWSDPFDAALEDLRPGMVLRFEVLPRQGSGAVEAKLAVRHALRRMVRMLDERPPSEFRAARSVAEVLEDLGHALSTNERELAYRLLDELRTSGDLDETNLAFLRLRVNADLELWEHVLRDPVLPSVLEVRRPPGVSRAIQQAVYGTYLQRLDEEERDDALFSAFRGLREQYAGLERAIPPPRSRPELIVQSLFALEADHELRPGLLERLLTEADEIALGLRQRLTRLQTTVEAQTAVAGQPPQDALSEATARYMAGDTMGAFTAAVGMEPNFAGVRLAVLAAADVGTVEAARTIMNVLERSPAFREELRASGVIGRAAVETVENLTATGDPDSWAAWFDRLAGGAARDEVVRWAREAGRDWPPLPEAEVTNRITSATDAVLEVFGEVAGIFLSAHSDVLGGPTRAVLAERLLGALALAGRTSEGVQVQALNLIDTLLSSEPTTEQVNLSLEWLDMLRSTMSSSGTVDWQVDLLQVTAHHPVPTGAETARQTYVFAVLEDLRRFRTALDRTTLESLAAICESLGMELSGELEALRAAGTVEEADLFSCLAGKTVVLYSLMESASRRAADTLRRLVPSIEVITNADPVGTERLADLSTKADVFVVSTAAAKHAATEFIESHRPPNKISYVHSKGSSALLSALSNLCKE